MASEATKMAVRGHMHMYTRVIEDAAFKSELKFDLRRLRGCLDTQRLPKWQLKVHKNQVINVSLVIMEPAD